MRKVLLFIAAMVCFAGGYVYHNVKDPFKLNYKRIAINLPITYTKYLSDNKYALGEKYLAEDMAQEFKRQGWDVSLYTFEDSLSNRDFKEGFELFMRSGPELKLSSYHNFVDKDRVAVLFETIPYEKKTLENADIILTGSQKKNKEYREKGLNSYYLPQFTRLDKFYYDYRPEFAKKVLYVANQWPGMATRKSVEYAKKSGIELAVYGASWENILVDDYHKWWKAIQIPNDQLKYFYSSADIVLNDTRPDMIEAGIISNRIFDATAAKAFVISDYMKEIEDIYGENVVMYKNEKEFKELIEYYLAHPEERRAKAEAAYQITKERFGADKVIRQMVDIFSAYCRKQGFDK